MKINSFGKLISIIGINICVLGGKEWPTTLIFKGKGGSKYSNPLSLFSEVFEKTCTISH